MQSTICTCWRMHHISTYIKKHICSLQLGIIQKTSIENQLWLSRINDLWICLKKYSNQIKLSLWHVCVLYIFYFQISESRFIAFVRKKWNHWVTQTRRWCNVYDYHLLYVKDYFENHWDNWLAAYMKTSKSHVFMYVPSNVSYNTQLNIINIISNRSNYWIPLFFIFKFINVLNNVKITY